MDDRHTPAGWYPDPLGLPQLRWWDGQGWGEHTSEARRPLVDQPVRTVTFADPVDDEVPVAKQPVAAAAATPKPAAEPTPAAPTAPEAAAAGAPQKPETAAPMTFASGPAALPAGPEEAVQGWAGAALTIHSMRKAGLPTILDIEVAGHPSITVDSRTNTFSWQLSLDRFPPEPSAVKVAVRIVDDSTPAPFENGAPLDGLLWSIGLAAFPEQLAPWLAEGAYRMSRWPDLSGFEPDPDPIRQAAMLSNGTFTIEQLANFTGRSIEPTRSLINALGLIGVLDVVAP